MEKVKLTKGDLINMFIRSNFQQASFNFERIHALGFCFDMVPAIKRLYHDKKEQAAALKRHMTFFNVTPACVGPVLGVTAAMEEAKANGAPVEDGAALVEQHDGFWNADAEAYLLAHHKEY
ncbi:MAG: PTS system mannose/fructose/sorbose family transporter subunit IID [Selenomonadaceae bacterium]|nr:PTS system mannose/fructose/sorbose family transporter subunit IID [Selenomonadaceae bacterium]